MPHQEVIGCYIWKTWKMSRKEQKRLFKLNGRLWSIPVSLEALKTRAGIEIFPYNIKKAEVINDEKYNQNLKSLCFIASSQAFQHKIPE